MSDVCVCRINTPSAIVLRWNISVPLIIMQASTSDTVELHARVWWFWWIASWKPVVCKCRLYQSLEWYTWV